MSKELSNIYTLYKVQYKTNIIVYVPQYQNHNKLVTYKSCSQYAEFYAAPLFKGNSSLPVFGRYQFDGKAWHMGHKIQSSQRSQLFEKRHMKGTKFLTIDNKKSLYHMVVYCPAGSIIKQNHLIQMVKDSLVTSKLDYANYDLWCQNYTKQKNDTPISTLNYDAKFLNLGSFPTFLLEGEYSYNKSYDYYLNVIFPSQKNLFTQQNPAAFYKGERFFRSFATKVVFESIDKNSIFDTDISDRRSSSFGFSNGKLKIQSHQEGYLHNYEYTHSDSLYYAMNPKEAIIVPMKFVFGNKKGDMSFGNILNVAISFYTISP